MRQGKHEEQETKNKTKIRKQQREKAEQNEVKGNRTR